ncbi:MAG TPA: lipid-A-disaccharide synthase [Flavitalea sp.]|nr:lipid-A-disaccharide synthase [Flavitalea sp.]
MRYYIIAGEASGDLHGSNLILELKKLDLDATIRCWGGDLMEQAGATVVKHYRELAFMGFVEVLMNIRTIYKNLRFCKNDISGFQPDALVLVDYPGFNLRIAEWAKQNGIPVIYYISPQVWAWKENRVNSIRVNVDKMLVILPFEEEFYRKWNYQVEYVGHPLVDVADRAQKELQPIPESIGSPLNEPRIIALLPGSRKQEVIKKLPVMLEISRYFPDHTFIVAKAASLDDTFYESLMKTFPKVRSVRNKTYHLLSHATAALVTSGTATLETALFGVPQVVCYKGSPVSYLIAKKLVKIKYISLVNLIMNREVVKELIQDDLNIENLKRELHEILGNPQRREKIVGDYNMLKSLLKKGGNASFNAAQSIYRFVKSVTSAKKPVG